jgi:hypothetical protein
MAAPVSAVAMAIIVASFLFVFMRFLCVEYSFS